MTCSTKREMLRTYLGVLAAQAQALLARAGEGPRLMDPVHGAYNGVPDPTDCCGRAVTASVSATDWADALRYACEQAEASINYDLDEMCRYLVWKQRAALIESKLQTYADYLAEQDQELGTMEIGWDVIVNQCPVPRIEYP